MSKRSGFTEAEKRAIFDRDEHRCVPHRGAEFMCNGSLVVHHRANRGMGGRASANRLSNGLTVCSLWNVLAESDALTAATARKRGWKIPTSWRPDVSPVFYPGDGFFLLDDDGNRFEYRDDVPF